jgi:hypothetical protein
MKNILITLLCLLLFKFVNGQPVWALSSDTVNIYTCGKTVESCEDRFENLLNNWDTWVNNNNEVKPVSYKYVETLLDSTRIEHYANLMYNLDASNFTLTKMSSKVVTNDVSAVNENTLSAFSFEVNPETVNEYIRMISMTFSGADTAKLTALKLMMTSLVKELHEKFVSEIQFGDKVYLIKFQTPFKVLDYYVICRPENCSIVSFDALKDIKK